MYTYIYMCVCVYIYMCVYIYRERERERERREINKYIHTFTHTYMCVCVCVLQGRIFLRELKRGCVLIQKDCFATAFKKQQQQPYQRNILINLFLKLFEEKISTGCFFGGEITRMLSKRVSINLD